MKNKILGWSDLIFEAMYYNSCHMFEVFSPNLICKVCNYLFKHEGDIICCLLPLGCMGKYALHIWDEMSLNES